MSTIVHKNVLELKPHPRNEEIYGANESIDELVETMRKSGIVTTLTITKMCEKPTPLGVGWIAQR